ncbi:MAG TPA: 3-oxoacyl-ACP reductase FabG [bacterium]|nr:3-oxoacyl-ACP reductase FabG [bacterium]
MLLKDQAALVTGGGAGIGQATAKLLAENGAAVMVADWNEDGAKATAEAITKAGGKAAHVKCDVSNQADAKNAVDKTVEAFGRIDILINNAGITRDASALKMSPEQWDQVIGVNLSGVFYCSQAAAAHMRERGYGRIVNASSISGFGNFGQSNYSATKAGLVGMTRTMAIEWGRYGITVNAIAPGFIKTSMTDAIPDEIREAAGQRIPVGRVGEPYDIARVYLFYASPESSFLTGTLLIADGGQTLLH